MLRTPRALWIIVFCLTLIPVLPFLMFGERLGDVIVAWFENQQSGWVVSVAIVAVLSTDVFLPIPSSFVSTWGGSQLGIVVGTMASWLGMTLGAVVGFWAAAHWGRPLVAKMAKQSDMEQTDQLVSRYGAIMVIATRAIPILAEVTVLLSGLYRQQWRHFLPAILISNLVISGTYSALGHLAREYEWLPAALILSAVIPLVVTLCVRRWLKK